MQMTLGFTLDELASLTGSKLIGNPEHRIFGVAVLESAGSTDASFLANPRYTLALQQSNAGVIFISDESTALENRNFLVADDPSRAFQTVLEKFISQPESGFSGVHESAVVHESVQLGEGVEIGPNAVIDRDVIIGAHSKIGAGVFIGAESTVGDDCLIHPNATVREGCNLGNRVVLQPGCVIGSCGFGYTTDKFGKHHYLKQLGGVVLEDDVEIGANTTIDRARLTETRIRSGTKVDNLVQIAHGVEIGRDCFIVGQAGIAGSAKLGNHVIIAGQSAVNGHIEICDGVIIGARSGVAKSIEKPGKYAGYPLLTQEENNRNMVHLKNLDKIVKMIKSLIAG